MLQQVDAASRNGGQIAVLNTAVPDAVVASAFAPWNDLLTTLSVAGPDVAIDQLRESVTKSAFLQVTATPYALYLQPDDEVVGPGERGCRDCRAGPAVAAVTDGHRFGARVHAVGDHPDSAAQMGINVNRIRIATFVFMGLGAAVAGVFSAMINYTWWPTTGDG